MVVQETNHGDDPELVRPVGRQHESDAATVDESLAAGGVA